MVLIRFQTSIHRPRPQTISDLLFLCNGPCETTATWGCGHLFPGAWRRAGPGAGPEPSRDAEPQPQLGPGASGGSFLPAHSISSESRFLFPLGAAKETSPTASVSLLSIELAAPGRRDCGNRWKLKATFWGRLTQRGGLGTDVGGEAGGVSSVGRGSRHGRTRPPPRKRPPQCCGQRPRGQAASPRAVITCGHCGWDVARDRPLPPPRLVTRRL